MKRTDISYLHNLLFGLHNQNLDHFESHLKSYSNKTQTATMMQVLSMKGMDVYWIGLSDGNQWEAPLSF
jgi:hypothetical protein